MAGLTTGAILNAINEGSSSYHTISFKDADGNPVVLETLRYTLVDSKGLVIIPWTDLSTDATLLTIPGAKNKRSISIRPRVLTLEGTYNSGEDTITGEQVYIIRDLIGIV